MAWGISAYLANKILDHICRNVAYTPPATVYAKMHTGDPGAAGTANASSVATRYGCAFNAAASGSITQSNTPEHTLGATETIAGVSFWDHPRPGTSCGHRRPPPPSPVPAATSSASTPTP